MGGGLATLYELLELEVGGFLELADAGQERNPGGKRTLEGHGLCDLGAASGEGVNLMVSVTVSAQRKRTFASQVISSWGMRLVMVARKDALSREVSGCWVRMRNFSPLTSPAGALERMM